jgi:hypothetical protein
MTEFYWFHSMVEKISVYPEREKYIKEVSVLWVLESYFYF